MRKSSPLLPSAASLLDIGIPQILPHDPAPAHGRPGPLRDRNVFEIDRMPDQFDDRDKQIEDLVYNPESPFWGFSTLMLL